MIDTDSYFQMLEEFECNLLNSTPVEIRQLVDTIEELKKDCTNRTLTMCLNTIKIHALYELGVNALRYMED